MPWRGAFGFWGIGRKQSCAACLQGARRTGGRCPRPSQHACWLIGPELGPLGLRQAEPICCQLCVLLGLSLTLPLQTVRARLLGPGWFKRVGTSGRALKGACRRTIDSACLRPEGTSSESTRLHASFEGSGQRPPVHRAHPFKPPWTKRSPT